MTNYKGVVFGMSWNMKMEMNKILMTLKFRAALPQSDFFTIIATNIRDGPIPSKGARDLSLFHYQGTSRTKTLVEHYFVIMN